MNKTSIKLLEYDKIKEMLRTYALSEKGKDIVDKMQPSFDKAIIEEWMRETTEGCAILSRNSSVPIHSLKGIDGVVEKLRIGNVMYPEELSILLGFLQECKKLRRFMGDKDTVAPQVSSYALSIYELNELVEEIDRCIFNGRVDDRASSELSRLRKKIIITEDRIKSKLDSILKSPAYKQYIQDPLVSVRDGRYVIPVKNEYRRNVDGSVLDSSSSGSTVFVEPAEVRKLQDDLNLLRIEEDREVYRILSTLTNLACSSIREISINIETMVHYDFIFAKVKYSRSIEGREVKLNTENYINIKGAKHPLIGKTAVPLNFTIGHDYSALVITGPNTGGKTVALKTVGLLTMMAQSGLHVPVEEKSEFAVFLDILTDIGDGQSIEQSLSTFSSHIRNITSIIECAEKNTLVIVDELGAGTDPGEGMGLAISILEEIYKKGATILATTHYSEIKDFANRNEGFKNGRMEFDINTLKPLYRLVIGEAGESNAFLIALRLGMGKNIIERAHEITYKEKKEYQEFRETVEEKRVENTEVISFHKEVREKSQRFQETRERVQRKKVEPSFKLGDCVFISSLGRTGVVCEIENSKGDVGVMVMKKKITVNKKRLSLYIDSKEMYPEDYDFDIIFESKENRKKDKLMGKRHVDGMTIERNL